MNATLKSVLVASVLAAFGTAAMAQEATPDTWQQPTTSKSRQEVASEMAAAKKDGTIKAVSLTYDYVSRSPSVKSRDEVRAEAIAARKSGETAEQFGEAYTFTTQGHGHSNVFAAKH
jgi:hypothetical protein